VTYREAIERLKASGEWDAPIVITERGTFRRAHPTPDEAAIREAEQRPAIDADERPPRGAR
jgi:hypothetical protein